MKFVKGDAIAGLIIVAVNLLGGILIVGLIAVLVRVQSSFRDYDARNPSP